MRPEIGDLLSVLAVACAAALVLPKLTVRSLRRRLLEVWAGRRQSVLGSQREAARMFQLGIPLHFVALVVERRGARRRQGLEALWLDSPAGLLLRQLTGRMTEPDRLEILEARGWPPPAGKLSWSAPVRLTMPPMSWRSEWERHLDSLRTRPGLQPTTTRGPRLAAPKEAARLPSSVPVELEIRTLGEIRLYADGHDLAPRLLRRPAQAATWLHLLAREARRPGDRLVRGMFADDLFPGLSPDQQRRKARQRLADLKRDLPAVLLRRIVIDGEYVGLDLTGCDLDVRRVLDLAGVARTLDPEDLLAPACFEQVEMALHASAQEFLPGWEEIERRATDGRSGMAEVVTDVRLQIEAAHLALLEALADAHMARQRPMDASPYLEEALRRRPDRDDLARKLVGACERGGLGRRAAELRQEYGLDEPGGQHLHN